MVGRLGFPSICAVIISSALLSGCLASYNIGVDKELQVSAGALKEAKEDIAYSRKAAAVHYRLSTAAAPLCEKHGNAGPRVPFSWFFSFKDIPSEKRTALYRVGGFDTTARVLDVYADGLAMGIQPGDALEEINGKSVAEEGGTRSLALLALAQNAGKSLKLKVGGKTVELAGKGQCASAIWFRPEETPTAYVITNRVVSFPLGLYRAVAQSDDEIAHMLAYDLAWGPGGWGDKVLTARQAGGLVGLASIAVLGPFAYFVDQVVGGTAAATAIQLGKDSADEFAFDALARAEFNHDVAASMWRRCESSKAALCKMIALDFSDARKRKWIERMNLHRSTVAGVPAGGP